MSGLLQRLAAQALGVHSPQAAPPVRSAMGVHAQVPVDTPREESDPTTGPRLLVDTPGFKPADSRATNAAPRPLGRSRTSTAIHSHSEQSPAPERIVERTARIEGEAITRASSMSDTPRERAPPESPARVPEPLLDEVAVTNAPPGITPIAPAPAISLQPPDHAHTEPTEVHVHIGRIEVIAAPEPAAPKKPRAPVRNTLPLSEYLAKRRPS